MVDNICQTCLSKNRLLIPQRSLRVLFQIVCIWEIKETEGGVCWECHHLLKRFVSFKAQVKRAQTILPFLKVQDEKSLSHLTRETKCDYDYQFRHSDPLNEHKIEIDFKQEPLSDDGDNDESQLNSKSDNVESFVAFMNLNNDNNESEHKIIDRNLNVDKNPVIKTEPDVTDEISNEATKTNTSKGKTRKKKKLKRNPVNTTEDVEHKYTTVVFSVEQMLKNRDEKRNHANYKKLPFKCDSCVLGFLRKDTYDGHMEKKHSETAGEYVCDVCQTRFPNLGCISRHCRKHFELYRCKLCSYSTIERWSVVNHCRAKHATDGPDNIHCRQCNWLAKSPEELEQHSRALHSLRCDACNERFRHRNSLLKHMRRIHGVKRDISCDICRRTFATRTRLETHRASHADAHARALAYCAACDVQYKTVHVYRNHLRNSANHAERAYACPECKKTFVSKKYLNTHVTFYHLRKSNHKCDMCNKLFISDWRLKNHKQVKHGLSRPRDHACSVCGKTFFTLAILRGHMYTHSDQRRFMCSDCGDTFKQRPALYTHTRLVHHKQKKTQPLTSPNDPSETMLSPLSSITPHNNPI